VKPLPAALVPPLRAALHLASPGGRRGSLLILMYHRVLAEADPLLPDEPDAATFAMQMDLVKRLCNVISLPEAAERLAQDSLPPRALAITFDDGYRNNLETAAPILEARGLTASFFIATGFIDGGCMFNDVVLEALRLSPGELDLTDIGLGRHEFPDTVARQRALSGILPKLKYFDPSQREAATERLAERAGLARLPRLMMNEDELRRLAGMGMDIGGHTVNHPILTKVSYAHALTEITECKRRLEEILEQRVTSFAYPNGRPGEDYVADHVSAVRDAAYSIAVTTSSGAARRASDPYQLPRVAPWDRSPIKYSLRLVRTYAAGDRAAGER
jgi:peptidoglycan/xylan/chitin deacetylase (PgdA/CDA1 family)